MSQKKEAAIITGVWISVRVCRRHCEEHVRRVLGWFVSFGQWERNHVGRTQLYHHWLQQQLFFCLYSFRCTFLQSIVCVLLWTSDIVMEGGLTVGGEHACMICLSLILGNQYWELTSKPDIIVGLRWFAISYLTLSINQKCPMTCKCNKLMVFSKSPGMVQSEKLFKEDLIHLQVTCMF